MKEREKIGRCRRQRGDKEEVRRGRRRKERLKYIKIRIVYAWEGKKI